MTNQRTYLSWKWAVHLLIALTPIVAFAHPSHSETDSTHATLDVDSYDLRALANNLNTQYPDNFTIVLYEGFQEKYLVETTGETASMVEVHYSRPMPGPGALTITSALQQLSDQSGFQFELNDAHLTIHDDALTSPSTRSILNNPLTGIPQELDLAAAITWLKKNRKMDPSALRHLEGYKGNIVWTKGSDGTTSDLLLAIIQSMPGGPRAPKHWQIKPYAPTLTPKQQHTLIEGKAISNLEIESWTFLPF